MVAIVVIGMDSTCVTTGASLAHLRHEGVCTIMDESESGLLTQSAIPTATAESEPPVRWGLSPGFLEFVLGATEASKQSESPHVDVLTAHAHDGAGLACVHAAAAETSSTPSHSSFVASKPTGSVVRSAA